jgi:hypothetical protein
MSMGIHPFILLRHNENSKKYESLGEERHSGESNQRR